jgi:hypothetical protein
MTGCNYDILVDCPATIPAMNSAKFRVRYRLPETAGRSTQRVAFWAAHESGAALTIPLVLSGETVMAESK